MSDENSRTSESFKIRKTSTSAATTMMQRLCIAIAIILLSHTHALARGFRRAPPISVEEEMGISPTLAVFSGDFFDPFGFATDDNFSILREAELKHGRVCMLATIGMIVSNDGNVLMALIHGHLPPTEPAIHALTPLRAAEVILVCGILETQVFVQQDPQDMPGDYGVGYFGIRDKVRNERSLICELENGRLAMIAFVVQVLCEAVTGKNYWDVLQDWLPFPVSEFGDLVLFGGADPLTEKPPIFNSIFDFFLRRS